MSSDIKIPRLEFKAAICYEPFLFIPEFKLEDKNVKIEREFLVELLKLIYIELGMSIFLIQINKCSVTKWKFSKKKNRKNVKYIYIQKFKIFIL